LLFHRAPAFNRAPGKPGAIFDKPEFVFGVFAAVVLYRREMLDDIGFLDDDLFSLR
jgi:hypothetical protein